MSADVELSYERIGLDGTVRLRVGVDGEEPYVDRVDLSSADDLDRYVDALIRRMPSRPSRGSQYGEVIPM